MGRFSHGLKLIEYIVPMILCIGVLIWFLKLYIADLYIPFNYGGDSLYFYALTKTIIENGWVWHNSNLGAPYVLENFDYPSFNILDCIGLKCISFFSSNPIFVENIYYLLTYPLTTLTCIIAFRQFNINYAYSVLGSLLFALMPYHFLRGVAHFNASSYYIIPLMVLVLIWIYFNEFALLKSEEVLTLDQILLDRKLLASVAICVLSGLSFLYYSYIFCLFLVLLGVLASVKSWRREPICVSFILTIFVIGTVILSLTPILVNHYQNGPNPEGVSLRHPAETEIYGMKIIQLLLPIGDHRVPFFSKIAQYYSSTAPLVNENSFSSLGAIASLGFVILIAFIFFKSYGILDRLDYDLAILNGLSTLNLFAILFATIGGLSSVVAYSLLSQFRSINRISIFIAFFSIFCILVVLNYISKLHNINKNVYFVAGILLVVGMLDQTSNSMVPSYDSIKQEYMNDDRFIKEIEAMMPENAMIAQLPYAAYPQYPAVNEMAEYSHFKGYLHSDKLRWSYGAMKGREGDLRYRLVANMPMEETIRSLSFEGFKGIYIDSFGYPDKGTKVITNISKILKIDPIVSDNHRLYFFDMRKSVRKFNTTFSKKLNPIVAPTSGFYGIESWSGVSTSWMQSDATLAVFSPDNCTAKLSLHALSFSRPRTIEIYVGDELAGHVPVPSTGFINVTAHVRLADGTNTVHMHVPEGCERPCDIKVLKNSDSRCLSIAVQNVTVA
jgi:hypothetical protein